MTTFPSASAPLEMRLLGAVDVSVEGPAAADDPHPLLRQPKRMALLVYLLLEGDGEDGEGTVDRDRLVDVFWPEGDDARSRGALRQSLRWLRQCLPESALVRRGNAAVGVDPALVGCDVVRFHRLLAAGRAADALELYRGDLLEGFVVDAGGAFDAWLSERRTRLRAQAAESAWGLAVQAEKAARRAEAAFWGKRALALSPFDEGEVRRLMNLLARIGDRAGVLRAYRGLEERLASDGRSPDALTRRIVEEVKKLDPENPSAAIEGGGGRRSGVDRRSGEERRGASNGYAGPERRKLADRRSGLERRSGEDRRAGT